MPIDEAVATQGAATTEPETAVGGSGNVAAQSATGTETASPSVNWDTLDLGSLPKSFIAKVEQKYLGETQADYHRKTQALAQERERLLDKVLQHGGQAPPPDERSQLLDRLKNGDLDVIDQYVAREVNSRLGPLESKMALDNAVAQARSLHPFISERESEVGQMIAGNPLLTEMVRAENFRYTPIVLQGAALAIENRELKTSMDAKIQAGIKDGIAKLSAQAKSLPSQTSKAGTMPSGATSGKADSWKRAALMAAEQHGVPVDAFYRELAERGK